MNIAPELLPVIQITLPLLIGLYVASTSQNKRLDDIVTRITAIEARLLSIENKLTNFENRITKLEERLPPLVHHN